MNRKTTGKRLTRGPFRLPVKVVKVCENGLDLRDARGRLVCEVSNMIRDLTRADWRKARTIAAALNGEEPS